MILGFGFATFLNYKLNVNSMATKKIIDPWGSGLVEDYEKIVKDFGTPDIVIDDGSHIMSDMKNAFELIYPYLNDNGVYCIEDLGVCGKGGRRNFYRPGDISMLDHLGTKVMEDLNLCKKDWTCSNKDKKLDMLKNSTPPLSVFEKTVYEMHLYTGLAIICKK